MSTYEQNILNTSLTQAMEDIGEARNKYKRQKSEHRRIQSSTKNSCKRLQDYMKISNQCRRAKDTCARRRLDVAHLIEKRNRLRAEVQAIRQGRNRMKQLENALSENVDNPMEGEYEGVGRYSRYRISARESEGGFRLSSTKIGGAEESIGVEQSFGYANMGKAFKFCLDGSNPNSCGRAAFNRNGFTFNDISFKRV